MLGMLVAYDAAGRVVRTLGAMTRRDAGGNVVGLIDFESMERLGAPLTDIWIAGGGAVGSGTWPEWLGAATHEYRVELEPGWSRHAIPPSRPHRIRALIHIGRPPSVGFDGSIRPGVAGSGYRRERASIERRIAARIEASEGPADIRDLVGGPDRPLRVDATGRTTLIAPPEDIGA